MRVLFATTNAAGHFGPLVPFARACRRAGHDVLVAGPASAAGLVRSAGLPFRPLDEPAPAELARVRDGVRSAGPAEAIPRAVRDLFVRCYAGAALTDMVAAIAGWRPDVVVRESAEFASGIAAERLGVQHVRVGIGLSALAEDAALAMAAPALDELRARVGLPPDPEAERARGALCLTQAPASLEPRSAPEAIWVRRFKDPRGGPVEALPDWWRGRSAPLLYVSFGTEVPSRSRPHFPQLYRTVLHALADVPVRVLVTIGRHRDPAELGPLPPSVHVERWIPQAAVMPHAAAMIGHGGSGSTLAALAHGVPMALVPLFADQPHNARRIAELGAGLALDPSRLDVPGVVAGAVGSLLHDPRHAAAAVRIAADIEALPPVDRALDALAAAALPSVGASVG